MKVKWIIITIMSIGILAMSGCISSSKAAELNNKINISNNEIKELKSEIAALESQKNEEETFRDSHYKEIQKKGEALMNNFKNIHTLKQAVNAYYFGMDGAPSEGYSDVLYSLYKKEGARVLIELLNDKDTVTIEGVTMALVNDYNFGSDTKVVDEMINTLNEINKKKLNDKKRYIIYRMIELCYLDKSIYSSK